MRHIGLQWTLLALVTAGVGGTVASHEGPCPAPRASRADIPVEIAHGNAATYFVRTDGGNGKQCDGRADLPYSRGSRSCAWKSLAVALPASGEPGLPGGAILRIGPGTYLIDQPLQSIPSGPARSRPTRILGATRGTTKLVGSGGIHRVLDLEGSANVEIGHLEITDGSDCVHRHSAAVAACSEGLPWARVGIFARSSSNVWLHDLNIHGLAARGVNAGALREWTVERVKINGNGRAGWDGNVGAEGSNSGRIVLRDMEIAWNGCGERVASGKPWACWGQKSGGYGDGLGTTKTGGNWLIEDVHVHHNTSDGLDLRYLDGADGTRATLRRVYAAANAGNQVKVRGNAVVEDSIMVGHCSYFRGRDFMTEGDLCRSDGSTLQLVLTGNDVARVRDNTLAGEGATQIGHSEGDSSDRIEIERNVVIGFPYYLGPGRLTAFDGGKSKGRIRYDGNMAWRVARCPANTACSRELDGMGASFASLAPRSLSLRLGSGRAGAKACGK